MYHQLAMDLSKLTHSGDSTMSELSFTCTKRETYPEMRLNYTEMEDRTCRRCPVLVDKMTCSAPARSRLTPRGRSCHADCCEFCSQNNRYSAPTSPSNTDIDEISIDSHTAGSRLHFDQEFRTKSVTMECLSPLVMRPCLESESYPHSYPYLKMQRGAVRTPDYAETGKKRGSYPPLGFQSIVIDDLLFPLRPRPWYALLNPTSALAHSNSLR
ncbi:hypothetical protein Ciccas_011260 [Cichlidogyrus casuarinus]|uniref:Uncharacterized protein n=1 Tax=Cichlidogyrus casuarinus TaxID=1844966 RepID=A0ABD2PUN8_9PLAT